MPKAGDAAKIMAAGVSRSAGFRAAGMEAARSTRIIRQCVAILVLFTGCCSSVRAQQPPEPVDTTPLDGETYYLINQADGLQLDLNAGSIAAGDYVLQQSASYTSPSQRWAVTRLGGGAWMISNLLNGLCLDVSVSAGVTWIVQNPCTTGTSSQEWSLSPTASGYYAIENEATGLAMDVYQGSLSAGAQIDQTSISGAATQTQQWLLRPVFLRGMDNALLEKQEAARVSQNLTWWKDAGSAADVLQMLKNHGINMVRLRPTSMPPYATQPASGPCVQNLCYAETEAQDLDLAKRAKNLGMSVELTLLFDGGNSASMPAQWTTDSFAQLQTDLYNYVFQEIERYRSGGAMPDLVAIGNEVDTAFLNGNDPGASFSNFAQLQIAGMKAVRAAAGDTSIGAALPAPLICIHITPAWDLTSFFTQANSYSIPYDAICQSYYPFLHGPLTPGQAAGSNPNQQPVEQTVLNKAASSIGKPIFLIETAEHYENGFDANDPWYPPSDANQRQFLIDLDSVLRNLPGNLAMGFEYWDPAGVNIPNPSGGFLNGDNQPNAIYSWNGLTVFDNADSSGSTNVNAANYSALLPGVDALGGKFDPSVRYKIVNRSTGNILESAQGSTASGASLDTATDTGSESPFQQWLVSSNGDGYFRITNAATAQSGVPNALDDSGGSKSAGNAVVQASASTAQEQEWDVVTAGGGYFNIVSRVSGLNLDLNAAGLAIQQTPGASVLSQQWQIVPVHVTSIGGAGFSIAADPPTMAIAQGAQGSVTLTLAPYAGYVATVAFSCSGLPLNATCAFLPSGVTFDGKDSVQSVTLTITTQGASSESVFTPPPPIGDAPPSSVLVLTAFIVLLFWLSIRFRHARAVTMRNAIWAVILACVFLPTGCGSSGSSSTPPPSGPSPTPIGTVVVTVGASATGTGTGNGNATQSVGILLDVTQ